MWTELKKYAAVFLTVSLLLSAEAETQKKAPAKKTPGGKGEVTEEMFDKKLFDPTLPHLTKERVNATFEFITNRYMNCSWPKSLKALKKERKEGEKGKKALPTAAEFSHFLFAYKALTVNPELPEVTKMKPEYFNRIGKEMLRYLPILRKIEYVCETDSEQEYANCIREYEDVSDLLEKAFKDKKNCGVSATEMKTIRAANTAKRAKEIAALKKRLGIVDKKKTTRRK